MVSTLRSRAAYLAVHKQESLVVTETEPLGASAPCLGSPWIYRQGLGRAATLGDQVCFFFFFAKPELRRKYGHQWDFFCLWGPERGIRLLCPGPLLQFTFGKDRINWVVIHFVKPGLKSIL